jgi:hypothetical protein
MSIEPDMFERVFAEWNHRLQQCMDQGGIIYEQVDLHGLSLNFRELALRRPDLVHPL